MSAESQNWKPPDLQLHRVPRTAQLTQRTWPRLLQRDAAPLPPKMATLQEISTPLPRETPPLPGKKPTLACRGIGQAGSAPPVLGLQ